MATYEELMNSAEQIRTNELPESNTHELVGKHLKNQVEHFNSENQGVKGQITALNKNTGISGYPVWKPNTAYAKGVVILNPDGQLVKSLVEQTNSGTSYNSGLWEMTSLDKENREKVAELEVRNAETKFAINESIRESIINDQNARDFFGKIIQKVKVKWDKSTVEDVGQKWSIVYLYVQSQDPGDSFDGMMQFVRIENNALIHYGNINIYDFGYIKGYDGILELKNIKPFNYNVTFDVTLNCAAIKLDTIYKFGNTENDPYAGKIYILSELYQDENDGYFYEAMTNKGKDFPIAYEDGVNHILNDFVLDASVIGRKKYRVNIAYIYRTTTNTGDFDNTIGFNVFDNEGNRLTKDVVYFKNDEGISRGKTGILDRYYEIESLNIVVKIRWFLDDMPNGPMLYGQSEDQAYYNKIPFSEFVYTLMPSNNYDNEDSFFFNALVNSGKDFPIWIDSSVDRNKIAIQYLKLFVLYAEIITTDDPEKYTYELAYINRSETNDGQFDNSIQLVRRERNDLIGSFTIVTINHIDDIKDGNKFWFTYKWENAIIRLYLDASFMPIGFWTISNGASSAPANDGKQYFDRYCYISYEKSTSENINETQIAKVVGDSLYIGAKYNDAKDILIIFEKCMFNNLMTFAKVGLADNTEAYPLPNPDRAPLETLNRATSDNIGPISVSNGGWCGANHSYLEQGTVKTAENISFEFYADGRKLNDGNIVSAKSIEVRVKNRIFNPTIPPEEGALILSSELCIEDVVYRVEKGNIFVSLNHTYTNDVPVTVDTYYGMQSMFDSEDAIITPNGAYVEFTKVDKVVNFTKSDYPNFRRFIERNLNGDRYQSTYLLPYEDGKHNLINDENNIFVHSSSKNYHRIMQGNEVQSGTIISWAGLYNWFTALQDDEKALVYTAEMQGKTYLFIDAKKAIAETYIKIPPQLTGQEYVVVEKSDTITTVGELPAAKGLKIASNNAGSLVLSFKL